MTKKLTRRELVKGATAALLFAGIRTDTVAEVEQGRRYMVVVSAADGYDMPKDVEGRKEIADDIMDAFKRAGAGDVVCVVSDGIVIDAIIEIDDTGKITKLQEGAFDDQDSNKT